MSGRSRVTVLVCGLLAALVVVGCGSDDETLTKAEFSKQADAICKRQDTKREAEVQAAITKQEKTGKPMSDAEGEDLVIDVALPPLVQMTEELADLGEPDPGAEQAEEMVSAFEDGIEVIEEKTPQVLKGTLDPFADAEKQAESFGLKACSEV